MIRKSGGITPRRSHLISRPEPGHLVQFYQGESSLLTPLTTFIGSGLHDEDTCIVIATAPRIRRLNERLASVGLNIRALQESGRYIVLDAAKTLARCMVDGLPDDARFFEVIGKLIENATCRGKRVRVYAEMVALLWQEGDKDGVLRLEELWNELGETKPFSLFCAYPELHFIMHHEVFEEIRECHSACVSTSIASRAPAMRIQHA